MTRDPVTVRLSASLAEAIEKLEKGRFRHLPVIDENGALVGMVTDRDVRLLYPSPVFVRPEYAPSQLLMMKVRQAAVLSPLTVHPDESLGETAALMLRHQINGLPVVSHSGVLVGIITTSDLLRAFVEITKRGEWESPGEAGG